MKKMIMVLVCLLLTGAIAFSAYAASGSVSISPSATTLYRGDTFTVVAKLSGSDAINLGTVVLSYDDAVFEMTGGTCHVSGANPAQVVPAQKAGTFFLGTATVVSGKIFTFNFKVKSDAAFGTYSISTKAAIGTSTGEYINASGTQVTVACAHQYGAWGEISAASHQRTCSVCQNVQTENHSWDTGSVLKQANCKEGGQVEYTCTACEAGKTQDTDKTNEHKYSSWTKVDDSNHTHTCSVCQKVENANHAWDGGKVTKKATCKAEGEALYTCTGCKTTKTEVLAILTTHTYDHGCDTDCNVCGVTRTTSHKYKTSWSKDKSGHWHECSECKNKKDASAHTPGAEPTETTAQTCTACGYVIKAALGHTHSYAEAWTTDEAGHWYACAGCDEQGSYAVHDFENACDPDCSVCGYIREAAHSYPEEWTSDAANHWHICDGCGLIADEGAHVPGAEATANTAQTCTVCAYELAPALGGGETQPTNETEQALPDGTDTPAKKTFPWWIILLIAVAAGCAAAVVIVKKKKA